MSMIDFCVPYVIGSEIKQIEDVLSNRKLSGVGPYAKKCQLYFENRYHFKKCLLTTSCTDALEMCAILINIQPGDEVIMPSYTFVSTANAFELRGAKIIFADSEPGFPNIDTSKLESLITDKTKAIVVVHYAGVSCDMNVVMKLAETYNLFVIEDAAQAIDSYYNGIPLGSIGHLAAFSFHETKNIIAGEGGMLVINDDRFIARAEIVLEKGTNRNAFFRGEVAKYGWVDIGSSFVISELSSSFLYAQLIKLDEIQKRRMEMWELYHNQLQDLYIYGNVSQFEIPDYSKHNGHIYFIICNDIEERTELMKYLREKGIGTTFHYLSLHKSDYFIDKYQGSELPNSDKYTDCLVRLPLHMYLKNEDIIYITDSIKTFYFSMQ